MNRRIDEIGKKKKLDAKHIGLIVIAVLLLFITIFGLIALSTLVGFLVGEFAGKAGYVYTLVLEYKECASLWSGLFGVAVQVPGYTNVQSYTASNCGMQDMNALFDCLEPGLAHVIMVSQAPSSSINWLTLQAATTEDIDAYIGLTPNDVTSANRTFNEIISFSVNNGVYNVPGTRTRHGGNGTSPFDVGALKDGNGNLIFISHINANFTAGFNNNIYNYQMIIPVANNTNPTYYVFTDPSYTCPAGEGEGADQGVVEGNVTTTAGTPLANVVVIVAGETAITDSTGYYTLAADEGVQYIIGVLTGYQAHVGNVTIVAQNTTVYNFALVPEAVPNPNTGTGVGPGTTTKTNDNVDVGPGEDDGPGEAPRVPIIEQPKRIEGVDYVISLNRIDRKLMIGNFLQEIISFYSYKKAVANLQFSLEDSNETNATGFKLSSIVKLDQESMAINPNANEQLTLTVFGEGEVGTYEGYLVVDGDLKERIPIRIELLDKDRLPIEALLIMLDIDDPEIFSSEKLKFKTDLHNLLSDQAYPVFLQYTIQNSEGETIWTDESNVYVQTSFSLLKSATLPQNVPTGDYVLRVTANYLGLSSGASTSFRVILPFYLVTFLGLKVWVWIIIIVFILLSILAYILIRRQILSKKKYSFRLEMSELPKLGPRSAFVGKIAETEHKTYFDLEQFKVHTIVAGATGGGKSVAAQVVVEEALLKNVAVIVFDPTAQWSGMLRKCTDKFMLSLYPLFGMKPTQARAFNGNVKQINNALELIDIKKYMKPGEIQILACNKLDPKDIDIFVANSIREVFHANFSENPELRLLLVYDEVHRLLPKFGGSGEGFLQIERGCREFRKWGIGILMISQVLADFVGQIKANINTEIQMRTRDEGDLARIKEKYGTEVLQGLVKASVGSGMVENPTYNRGRPYFVAFRPLLHNTQRLPDEELEKYNKWNEIIGQLDYELQQLEELKQDVFDLKLQLKLALDKVKSGNFNMVEIYLQEVIPRVEKTWKKLGKAPQKLVIKTIDINALKEDMKKAAEEKKKADEEAKKNAPKEAEGEKKEEKKMLKYEYVVSLKDNLTFNNGVGVASLQELYDVMPNINGPTLKHHVTKDKNDIADWVRDKFGDTVLADKLRLCKTNEEFVKTLEEDKTKNNKPFDPTKIAVAGAALAPVADKVAVVPPSPEAKQAEAAKADQTPAAQQAAVQAAQTPVTPQINPETGEGETFAWNEVKSKIKSLSNDDQIKMLEKSIKKYSQDINIKFPLALLYHKTKQYDKAEKIYKEILELYPKNSKALFYLGGLMKSLKRYDEALKYFNIYMDVKKNDPKVKDLITKLEEKNKPKQA
ncbi:MAG TPA: tetratricopeptide repeat protein [Alphaproteobacteria bacterium]|nr:tetratricopeptide repeat protein [Alphaproteobacteria bacterium]